ncbi:thioredoxin [Chloroflexota bacterium]
MAEPINIDEQNFNDIVLQAKNPFLVDFWAPWCGPCKAIAPIVEELATEYSGRVGFAKINVDDNPVLATTWAIRSIPTLLIFKDGKPVQQVVGARPKAELKKYLDEAL